MHEGSIIRVTFEEEGGWFTATSDDLPGLFLANRDAYKVFCAIPEAVRILLEEQPVRESVVKKEEGAMSICTIDSIQNHWIALSAQTWPRFSFQIGEPVRHEHAHT